MSGFDFCEEWDCDSDYCLKISGKKCKKPGDENCIMKGTFKAMKEEPSPSAGESKTEGRQK